jgi:hypothetical protein
MGVPMHLSSRLRFGSGAGALVFALIGLSGCAEIRTFTVTPHDICPGTSVKTDWDISGKPKLTTTPPLAPQSERVYVPTSDTDFTLTAKALLNKKTAPPNTVTLYTGTPSAPKEMPQPLVFRTTCVDGVVIAAETLLAEDWDPKLAVATITSGEDRDITIEHDGKQATFTAQNPTSSGLTGTKMVGMWRITVPLKPGESCSGSNPPTELNKIVLSPFLYCGS